MIYSKTPQAVYWREYRKRKANRSTRPIHYRTYNKKWLEKNQLIIYPNPFEESGWTVKHMTSRGMKTLKVAMHKKVTNSYKHGDRLVYEVGFTGYASVDSEKKTPITVALATLIYIANGGVVNPGEVVDHINNNPLDNRIENLQAISRGENTLKNTAGHNQFTPKEELRWVS